MVSEAFHDDVRQAIDYRRESGKMKKKAERRLWKNMKRKEGSRRSWSRK